MENRKGNVVIMTIAIVVAAIITAASVWLFVGSGIVSKQGQDAKIPVSSEKDRNSKDSSVNADTDKVIFRDEDLGFQLTMPKEWEGYALYAEPGQPGETCLQAMNIFLPSGIRQLWPHSIMVNDKTYFLVARINVCTRYDLDEILKCKEGQCADLNVIGSNKDYVFTFDDFTLDLPSDYAGPFRIDLNFPENFNKYFKFEPINR